MTKSIELCAIGNDLIRLTNAIDKYGHLFRNLNEAKVSLKAIVPKFPSRGQIEYLKSLGAKLPESKDYRIYFSEVFSKSVEQLGGAHLPTKCLEDIEQFDKEVISRIRNQIGTIQDN